MKKTLKIYGFIGQALLACAGGIIGFLSAGPLFALLGVAIGALLARLLNNAILRAI